MESAELLESRYRVLFPRVRRSWRSHLLLLLCVLLLFLCRPFPFLAATHTVGYGLRLDPAPTPRLSRLLLSSLCHSRCTPRHSGLSTVLGECIGRPIARTVPTAVIIGDLIDAGQATLLVIGESRLEEQLDKVLTRAEKTIEKEMDVDSKEFKREREQQHDERTGAEPRPRLFRRRR